MYVIMYVLVTLGTIAQREEQSIKATLAAEVGEAELEMSTLRRTGCPFVCATSRLFMRPSQSLVPIPKSGLHAEI